MFIGCFDGAGVEKLVGSWVRVLQIGCLVDRGWAAVWQGWVGECSRRNKKGGV